VDNPGIESQWWQDFLHPSRLALGPTQPPIRWVPSLPWWGGKQPECGFDPLGVGGQSHEGPEGE